MKYPESIARIVTRFGQLKQLSLQAERLTELNGRIRGCLPAELAPHVSLANIREGCAILHADSPAWATAIRYRSPEILAELRGLPGLEELRSIRVRNASRVVHSETPITRSHLSADTAAGIRAQADSIGDPALRDALLRIADRGEQKT